MSDTVDCASIVTETHNRNLIGYFEQINQSDFKDLFLLLTTDAQSTVHSTDVFQDLATQTVDRNFTLIGYSQKSSQSHRTIQTSV